ncbi:hypothetical protein B4147_0302 [Bacillus wiedmannii]|uniref:Uncharacterized protein n=1 Tax=Bacillus wiedmannii TaxID=1890302 RepID=A0A0G8BV36_9BACI|nr:hypothetical protein B4147_0302 [Bacillus wiedmannii]
MESWKLMAAITRLGVITYTTITWVKLSTSLLELQMTQLLTRV